MPTVGAILLDLYDTLVRPDWAVLDAGRAALAAQAGAEPAALAEEWRRTQNARFRGAFAGIEAEVAAVLAACGVAVDGPLQRRLGALERATWSRGIQLYDDALPQMRALRRRGYRLAIVSNCGWQTAARVEELRLAQEVDAVVLSCEAGVLKPDPAIFGLALERLGVPASRALLVDDRPEHLDAAGALGLRTALIARDGFGAPRGPAAPATLAAAHPRIAALAELRALLG